MAVMLLYPFEAELFSLGGEVAPILVGRNIAKFLFKLIIQIRKLDDREGKGRNDDLGAEALLYLLAELLLYEIGRASCRERV